ncbi:LOW QUALITY PROTEIN: LMBR1 domain-containing protein 2 homolog [Lepeophtheirus salmonis]|nr:LOW QUALITY PROTEIN: LMBR1 domain-containing protein 2 homolog [Lepeophtheirus salmonis]
MSATVFISDLLLAFIISGFLLYRYGDWFRQRIIVTIAVFIAWYFSFIIVFIIPLDVSMTKYRHCLSNHNLTFEENFQRNETSQICYPPYSILPANVLPNLWRIVYWTSQFLTWLVLPLMRSFTQAGEFGFGGKLKSALWDNIIYYTTYLLIALIIFVYILFQPGLHLNLERLKAIASSASNTWGLFVLVLMLGYGLIEVPRNLWNASLRGYSLNRAYFKLAKLMSEKAESEEEVEDSLSMVLFADERIKSSRSPELKTMVDTIISKIPVELYQHHRVRARVSNFDGMDVTEKSIISLHRRVIKSLQTHHRTQTQWQDLTDTILELEDINRNIISNEHVFRYRLGQPNRNIFLRVLYNPTIEWYWKCLLRPLTLKIGAIFAVIMSTLIIWSEITFFVASPPLSFFAIFVQLSSNAGRYFLLEFGVLITTLYLCTATVYTVFKIRILNYYYLAKNHQSDEYTLLFSGALLCRLTPPLVLNFLSLIHMDSHIIGNTEEETSYTSVMGHMDLISLISDYFNVYFPMLLLAFSTATYFSLGARCISALGFQQFLTTESELTLEMVKEGKEHIDREKRMRSRYDESGRQRRNRRTTTSISSNNRDLEIPDDTHLYSNDPIGNSSPERELLVKDVDPISSPSRFISRTHSSPPRNIFDDL